MKKFISLTNKKVFVDKVLGVSNRNQIKFAVRASATTATLLGDLILLSFQHNSISRTGNHHSYKIGYTIGENDMVAFRKRSTRHLVHNHPVSLSVSLYKAIGRNRINCEHKGAYCQHH